MTFRWLRWRRSEANLCDQLKAWRAADPQMPTLILPGVKPLRGIKIDRVARYCRRNGWAR